MDLRKAGAFPSLSLGGFFFSFFTLAYKLHSLPVLWYRFTIKPFGFGV